MRSKKVKKSNNRILPLVWKPLFIILAWFASAWLVDPMEQSLSAKSSFSTKRWRNSADSLSVNLSDILSDILVVFWDLFASISRSCLKIASRSFVSWSHLELYLGLFKKYLWFSYLSRIEHFEWSPRKWSNIQSTLSTQFKGVFDWCVSSKWWKARIEFCMNNVKSNLRLLPIPRLSPLHLLALTKLSDYSYCMTHKLWRKSGLYTHRHRVPFLANFW